MYLVLLVAVQAVPVVALAGLPGAGRDASCSAESADVVSAAAMARVCNSRVEVLSGRSEYAQVFANPDGTSTFEATAVPARVRRPDGSWVAVDIALHVRADGSLVPGATLSDVVLSGGGTAPFVTYRYAGSALTLSWPSALPRPSIDVDTAVYADVLPGVDLRVTVTATGFRHVLVVKTPAAARSEALARIRYQVGGDVAGKALADGRVRFADGAGRAVAITAAASMWDSSVEPGAMAEVVAGVDLSALRATHPAELVSTAYGPGATAVSARLAVGTDAANGLVLKPDVGLLTGPKTVFPVFIDPEIAPVRTKWAYADSTDVTWAMDGKAWVGNNPAGPLFRSFFDFPTTSNDVTYKGKHVLSASFSIELTHSWSCTDTTAHLYRTGAITVSNGARMSWGTRALGLGAKWLAWADGHANEAGGCGYIQPNMIMTFGGNETMRADVDAAAKANWNTYTVGICACNANGDYESSQDRWKKFLVNEKTTMSVRFNTVPGTPVDLSPHQGEVGCGAVVASTSPVLRALYVDADGGDSLSATFNWQELASGAVTSVAGTTRPANTYGTATLSLGSGAQGRSYQFQVRTYDGHDYSPWSPWCGFTVDTQAPLAPVVTPVAFGSAPLYTGCDDPANISSCPANGGPGVAGAFTFSEPDGPAGDDVVRYVYGWDSPSRAAFVAPGASYGPVLLTPPHYGINRLAVYSVDGAGSQSPTTVFSFQVAGPSRALAHWPLDSIDGHALTDLAGGGLLSTTGVTWTPDARFVGADAATFSSTAEARQSVASFDTSGSFSVAAWVRLSSVTCAGDQTAVSVDAASVAADNHASGMFLSFDCMTHKWRLRVPASNVASPATADAWASTAAVAGRWTFLVGVWDENEQQVRLYVNGTLSQQVTPTSTWLASRGAGWKASGPVAIGRGRWNDTDGGHLVGEVADVRLWNRVVVPDDIWGTDADATSGVPAQMGLLSPLQVGSWQLRDGECYCTRAPDDSVFGRDLFLTPNWGLDPGWNGEPATTPAWLTGDSHDGDGALRLDGGSGYASTTDDAGTLDTSDDLPHPVLRTDQSVSVTAWVNLNQITNVDQVVVHAGAVVLFFRGWEHKWGMTVSSPNGSGGFTNTEAASNAVAETGTWVHLVGEFDASTGQVRLYVNGVLQNSVGTGATGWHSTGSLMIGSRGGRLFFGGTVDQVRVWQGLLSPREIQNLYRAT